MIDITYDGSGRPVGRTSSPEALQSAPQEQIIEQEVAQSEPIEQEQPVEQQASEHQEEAPKKNKVDPSESFRAMRDRLERAERERDEMARLAQELSERTKVQEPEMDDDDISLGDNDLAEGKHLSRVQKQIKKLKSEIRTQKEQMALTATEVKLKAQYPDFDAVVNRDTIDQLRLIHPEIAATINSSPDIYAKAVSAYTMIKNLGIYQPKEQYMSEKERIAKNAAKPKSSASISPQQGSSPLQKANMFGEGITKDLKEQLYREMKEAAKYR